MPNVTISLFEGRDTDTKRQLVRRVTDSICEVVGCSAEAVTVTISEMPRCNYAKGGILYCDREK